MNKTTPLIINLRSEKTEYLSDDEVYSFFVHSKELEQITKIRNTFLIGHKGSGKSFLLKYLSIPIQLIRFTEKTTIPYDERAIGILIQCKVGKFGGLREPNSDKFLNKDWISVFIHAFNLSAIQILLEGIRQIFENKHDVTKDEVDHFLDEIIRLFRFDISLTSFDKVFEFIDDEISSIQEEYQQNKLRNDNRFYTDYKLLHEIRNSFKKCFNNYKNIEPIFLLDEYNELSAGQQRVINEMINIRQPVFKMSSVPHGIIKDRIFDGQIDIDHDYEQEYLGNKPLGPKSEELPILYEFMTEMWNKRVEKLPVQIRLSEILESPKPVVDSGKKHTQADVRMYNENNYCGVLNYVILSEGNPKTFLDLIQDTIDKSKEKRIDLKSTKISTSIQLDVITEYSRQRRKEVVQSDSQLGRSLQRLIEWLGKYLKSKSEITSDSYRKIAIKDPESLSNLARDTIELGLRSSWLIQEDLGRVSKNERIRLETFTLKNILVPSFEIPLSGHQVWEITSNEINNLLEGKIPEPSIPDITNISTQNITSSKSEKTLSLEAYESISEILELIKKNELILFVGSGLSTHAGIVSAQNLSKKICQAIPIKQDVSLEKASEYYSNKFDNDALYTLIEKEINSSTSVNLDLHKKLSTLKISTLITTNWDKLLEITWKESMADVQVLVSQDQIINYQDLKPGIFKIHGDLDNRDLLVTTEQQYDNYSKTHDFMLTRLKSLLQNKSILFIGYSLSDRNFIQIRNMVGSELGKLRNSYAVFLESNEHEIAALKKKNIKVIVSNFVDLINALVHSH